MVGGCAVIFRILYSLLSIMLIINCGIYTFNAPQFHWIKKKNSLLFLPCRRSLLQFTEADFRSDQHHGQKQNCLVLKCHLRNLNVHVWKWFPPRGLITETNLTLQHSVSLGSYTSSSHPNNPLGMSKQRKITVYEDLLCPKTSEYTQQWKYRLYLLLFDLLFYFR